MDRQHDAEPGSAAVERMLAAIEARGIHTISLQFTDISGQMRGVSIPAQQLPAVLKRGQWADGSSIESAVRLHESDMLLRPDAATFAVVSSEEALEQQGLLMCALYTMDNHPFPGDPRAVLSRALAAAAERGYAYQAAPEIEFYICQADADGRLHPLAEDQDGYFGVSVDQGTKLRHELVAALRASGIEVEGSHHEVAPGQHEIDLAAADALRAADHIVIFKYLARQLARQHGLRVTFMPKPFNGLSGSGMHIHQMLGARDDGANLFGGQSHRTVSDLARHFIAGQLQHAPAFTAVTNPLVNSYKRLASGYEAPATISWAHENRSAFIRVPVTPRAQPDLARVELRGGDPSCNPYLALAAMLRAGLAGIDEQANPPEPVEEQVYPFETSERLPLGATWLPLSLGEALATFSESRLMRDTFGEYIFARFLEMKRREWRTYQTQVTDWEQQTCWKTA
ncbi:MAG TPA: glutamine synthetase family protein [Ktedonobacterales bacterium]|nr:glutamine synthetase family protein [Ktedonobacterales bacterium]